MNAFAITITVLAGIGIAFAAQARNRRRHRQQFLSETGHSDHCDVATASERYAQRFSGEVGAFFNEVEWRYIAELLDPKPGATVLDVGGAHARAAIPFSKCGCLVTVTGSEAECQALLESRVKGESIHFVECLPHSLPFPDRSFDYVVATRMLSHVASWQSMLSEMCRVARHAILVDYADQRSVNFLNGCLTFTVKNRIEKSTRPYRTFRRQDLLQELKLSQYACSAARRQFLFPMAMHRGLKRARLSRCLEHCARQLGLTKCFGSPVLLAAKPLQPRISSAYALDQTHTETKNVIQ